jgi:hypothetical protein
VTYDKFLENDPRKGVSFFASAVNFFGQTFKERFKIAGTLEQRRRFMRKADGQRRNVKVVGKPIVYQIFHAAQHRNSAEVRFTGSRAGKLVRVGGVMSNAPFTGKNILPFGMP